MRYTNIWVQVLINIDKTYLLLTVLLRYLSPPPTPNHGPFCLHFDTGGIKTNIWKEKENKWSTNSGYELALLLKGVWCTYDCVCTEWKVNLRICSTNSTLYFVDKPLKDLCIKWIHILKCQQRLHAIHTLS